MLIFYHDDDKFVSPSPKLSSAASDERSDQSKLSGAKKKK